MTALLTIITPCFNSEKTLEKTLQSVFNQSFQDWELIIVNDGSTDDTEKISLEWVQKDPRFKYFYKENGGLGKARNYGIERATGTYILPLDSDNLVEKHFIKDAIKVFENNKDVGVVHGYAEYFGEKEGIWIVEDFNLQKMLVHNYIDACAIFKKELWERVGGYDEKMPYQGHEDWDFWISLNNLGAIFFNLHEITFKYYVSSSSMIRSFNSDMFFLNQDYIVKKHSKLYYNEYYNVISSREKLFASLKSKKNIINLFTSTFFRFKFFK